MVGQVIAAIGFATFCSGIADDPRTIPGWGEVVDPKGDSRVSVREDGAVVIAVSAIEHDFVPAPEPQDAPRVWRPIEGNFTTQVRIAMSDDSATKGDVDEPSRQVGAGLILWQDERNFVRFELGPTPHLTYWKDGQSTRIEVTDVPEDRSQEAWIRMTRRLAKLTAEVSIDSENWSEVAAIPIRLSSRMQLGVMAVNPGAEPITARFQGFEVRGISLYP